MITGPYTVGALYRRSFRRLLLTNNIDFVEDKSFVNSLFMVTADKETHENIINVVKGWLND